DLSLRPPSWARAPAAVGAEPAPLASSRQVVTMSSSSTRVVPSLMPPPSGSAAGTATLPPPGARQTAESGERRHHLAVALPGLLLGVADAGHAHLPVLAQRPQR